MVLELDRRERARIKYQNPWFHAGTYFAMEGSNWGYLKQ
jgi:hypothetical protein